MPHGIRPNTKNISESMARAPVRPSPFNLHPAQLPPNFRFSHRNQIVTNTVRLPFLPLPAASEFGEFARLMDNIAFRALAEATGGTFTRGWGYEAPTH